MSHDQKGVSTMVISADFCRIARHYLWFCCLVVSLTLSLWGLSEPGHAANGTPPTSPPAPVTTVLAEGGAFAQAIRITGTVEPMEQTTIASEVAGYLDRVLVDEGSVVKAGTPLAQLRDLPYRLSLERLEAVLRVEQERLRELRVGTRKEDLAVARANLARARVVAETAQRDYERSQGLFQKKILSQGDLDKAQERWESSRAELDVQEAIYARARVGARTEEIAAAEAQVAASKAEVAMARDRLERATIRAPFDGVVTKKHKDQGSWVKDGDALIDLDRLRTVQVRMDVPEQLYHDVALGTEVSLTFDSVPNKTFTGKVSARIPRAEGRSRSLPIKVEIPNSAGELAGGMMARVTLQTPTRTDQSVIVPRDALVPHGPTHIVFRVQDKDGKPVAEMVEVMTGRYFGEAVEVFGTLQAGDRVVVRGNERLQTGQPLILDRFLPLQNGDRSENSSARQPAGGAQQ